MQPASMSVAVRIEVHVVAAPVAAEQPHEALDGLDP
jgi:hypothetical protein